MRNGFIFSLIAALIVAIFAIQNAVVMPIKFLFWQANISLALIILISAILGAVIVALLGIKKEFNMKKENKNLVRKVQELEENIKASKYTVDEKKEELTQKESAMDNDL